MKAVAFIDYENIWTGLAEKGCRIMPEVFIEALHKYAQSIDVELSVIFLYANFDKEEFWRMQTVFEKKSIITRHVYGKNSFAQTELRPNAADHELMLEAQEILLTRPDSFDIFLLFTGDGDFMSLVRKIRAWGKKVKIIGVKGKIHHDLEPFCESMDVFLELTKSCMTESYEPEKDILLSLKIIIDMQIKLPYLASTKVRNELSRGLSRNMTEVKELVQYMLDKGIILEKEHVDPNLKIRKTKAYLLNCDNSLVKEALGDDLELILKRSALLEQE
ncbi:protein of unknown function DUF88 [Syntrophobotulus glycolicus DSM 8271]|uniref:NYN domain-containing protein n=1 Tax=Syntrophobotulus glycolicus (strain DSM 8271 / FlGlyR) TaxID=645991 RepID=F0SX97_SYNGF|nr:NYN domain-containing protein [Syntrophobotulus glycolicus]ADY56957.1 protein of unknown function DUF88 [Syntrophobotulus glycolicus DSM 8271]